jgi:hypothetical protein
MSQFALPMRLQLPSIVINLEWSSGGALRQRWQPDPWRPSWNNKAYQDLGQMMESVPSGSLRDHGLNRIRILDCANPDSTLASCDPAVPPPAEAAAWRNALEGARVDDAAYFAALATALKTLVCSGGDDAAYAWSSVEWAARGRRSGSASPD